MREGGEVSWTIVSSIFNTNKMEGVSILTLLGCLSQIVGTELQYATKIDTLRDIHEAQKKHKTDSTFTGRFWEGEKFNDKVFWVFRTVCLWSKHWQREKASFPEKGAAGDGVPQVGGLSLRGLSQWEDLLLRHTGWNGNVTLVKWVKALVQVLGMWWDRTRVTNGFYLPLFGFPGIENGLLSLLFTDLHAHLLILLNPASLPGKGL